MSAFRENTNSGDLITFEDEDEERTLKKVSVDTEGYGRSASSFSTHKNNRGKPSLDIKRVLMTEIDYYRRDAIKVPQYGQDSYFHEDRNIGCGANSLIMNIFPVQEQEQQQQSDDEQQYFRRRTHAISAKPLHPKTKDENKTPTSHDRHNIIPLKDNSPEEIRSSTDITKTNGPPLPPKRYKSPRVSLSKSQQQQQQQQLSQKPIDSISKEGKIQPNLSLPWKGNSNLISADIQYFNSLSSQQYTKLDHLSQNESSPRGIQKYLQVKENSASSRTRSSPDPGVPLQTGNLSKSNPLSNKTMKVVDQHKNEQIVLSLLSKNLLEFGKDNSRDSSTTADEKLLHNVKEESTINKRSLGSLLSVSAKIPSLSQKDLRIFEEDRSDSGFVRVDNNNSSENFNTQNSEKVNNDIYKQEKENSRQHQKQQSYQLSKSLTVPSRSSSSPHRQLSFINYASEYCYDDDSSDDDEIEKSDGNPSELYSEHFTSAQCLQKDDTKDNSLSLKIKKSQKLPLRPPPPLRKQNRFSSPPGTTTTDFGGTRMGLRAHKVEEGADKQDNIFFQSGLFQKGEERNEEAEAFADFVAKLRNFYKCDDHFTNTGYVTAAKCENKALLNTSKNVTMYFDPDPKPHTIPSVPLSANRNEIIHKFFAYFYSGNNNRDSNVQQGYELDLIAEKYTLKFVGHTCCMEDDAPICDFVIVQDCIKHGYEIELALVRKDFRNIDFKRDKYDDEEDCRGTYFRFYFQSETTLAISEQGLTVLLDAYNNEAKQLMEEVSQSHKILYRPERLIQVVKAISKSLAQVELLSIQDGVNLLLALKNKTRSSTIHVHDLSAREAFSKERQRNYSEYINPVYFDKERFQQALQKLTFGVFSLIEVYCKAFNTDFQIQQPKQQQKNPKQNEGDDKIYERIDPRTIDDNFAVRISSVHRIPATWNADFNEFEIEAGVYYGGRAVCPRIKTSKCRLAIGFFEQIRSFQLLEFDLPVKRIPRESKVTFKLIGFSTPKKGDDGKTLLGWVSCNIYDFQGYLLSGKKLFGLVSDVVFNPVATCSTGYIQKPETVILNTEFQAYPTDVLFPQPFLINSSPGFDQHPLSEAEIEYVKKMLRKDPLELTSEEKFIVWKGRFSLCKLSHALIHVLHSCPSWDSVNVSEVHSIISVWERLSPDHAIEFLQADFPDKTVRDTVVSWLSNISNDDLCDYLPELVQAIKYEAYHNSALAQFLIKRSITSSRVAHFLFWHLKYYTADLQFAQRFQIVISGLLSACGSRLRNSLELQDQMVMKLSQIAQGIKQLKDSSARRQYLTSELQKLNESDDIEFPLRSPLEPSLKISGVDPGKSSCLSSFTMPIKMTVNNSESRARDSSFIYKIGDDLRKDMVTLLMFRIMNKLWLNEGLDLKMMMYTVLPTGPLQGIIEMVPNAKTFREIHIQYGLTGSFKDNSLALWLQKYNTAEQQYEKAINNFMLSAAGYCVATYLLGIGDRHNDNIMLTKNGHLFHIDFSKFMGDVQKFGNINRDRVPFILTPDMAYVINNGLTPTQNFQRFVENCCQAFNILRRKMKVLLNLLGLMVYSGISYLSEKEDLMFVRRNLQLHLTEDEATMYFTRLIESSLSSRSVQLNFFIHNIAQMKNVEPNLASSKSSPLFSFSNKLHTKKSDGEIMSARIVDFQKRYLPDKHYVFVINILRTKQTGPKFIFRRYEDFQELHAKLNYFYDFFTGVVLPELPARVLVGRSQIREVARRRRFELDQYLVDLSQLKQVWESDVVCTFLHSYINDNEEARRFSDYVQLLAEGSKSRVGGKLKLSISYKNYALNILVMHASNLLPNRIQGLADPFVKAHLLPDPLKLHKRKTRVCRKSLNPTFNETLDYKEAWEFLEKRILQITVWDYNNIRGNEYLGGINFYLSTFDPTKKSVSGWFELTDLGLES